jgi:CO/xanthine dehydrogenase Mo-binding subunit
MTGLLNERELSRKTFLKGSGALIVGFSMAGAGLAGKANAADSPYASNGAALDLTQVDSWLTIHADNTATIKSGIVELGQGSSTGILMIAAEELDMSLSQLRTVYHDTNVTPNQGSTSGSNGTKVGGKQVRAAAAVAKQTLLGLASASLGVPVSQLSVTNGVVSGGRNTVTYGQLLGDKLFNVQVPASFNMKVSGAGAGLTPGQPPAKALGQYKLVGTNVPRIDIPAKISGQYTYVHNIRVPGMLHGRVVRPRGQGAYGDGTAPKILSIDERSIAHIPGARALRFGDYLGVVAPREYDAIQAAAQLKVAWADNPPISGNGNLWKQMRAFDSAGQAPASVSSALDTVHNLPLTSGDVDSALASAAVKLSQTYKFHWNIPAPIGPQCAVADVSAAGARIFANAEDAYGMRQLIKNVLDPIMGANSPPLERIRVTHYEGSSAYGGKSNNHDVAQGAAVLSALSGAPVRLQLMRWDEHGWNDHWTAIMFDIRAGIDGKGNLVGVEHTNFLVPFYSTEAAQQQVTGQIVYPTSTYLASTTIGGLQYGVANRRAIVKALPLKNNYFRTSYVRSPYRVQASWAGEQMFDELAHAAGMDPYTFRLQNVATTATDPLQRWRYVLTSVAKLANWQPKVAASKLTDARIAAGRGIAFGFDHGTVIAAVADVEVDKQTGKIAVKHVHCCVDPGVAINPAGLQNNLEGDVVQTTSRLLLEETRFNTQRITSLDWVSYPVLRFKDTPMVTVQVLSRTDIPDSYDIPAASGTGFHAGGGGEGSGSATAPAIANAFFDATGVRMRETPMTPARVRAALKPAGVA